MPVRTKSDDVRRASARPAGFLYDYVEGGGFDEISHRLNRNDIDAIPIRQRAIARMKLELSSAMVLAGKRMIADLDAIAPDRLQAS